MSTDKDEARVRITTTIQVSPRELDVIIGSLAFNAPCADSKRLAHEITASKCDALYAAWTDAKDTLASLPTVNLADPMKIPFCGKGNV